MSESTQSIESLGLHRGAIDQTTITTQLPPDVMENVKQVLEGMGIEIQVESKYRYRCIRARREIPQVSPEVADVENAPSDPENTPADDETTPKATYQPPPPSLIDSESLPPDIISVSPPPTQQILYGERSEDPGDEVRFSVELTRLDRLVDTYSLDIRRLKGNLRSYKFLYDTLRQRANLQR